MKLASNIRSIAMYTAWDLTYLTKSRTEKRVPDDESAFKDDIAI